jgi:hypothetical protein
VFRDLTRGSQKSGYGHREVRLADGPVRWNDWDSMRTGPPYRTPRGLGVRLTNRSEFPLL